MRFGAYEVAEFEPTGPRWTFPRFEKYRIQFPNGYGASVIRWETNSGAVSPWEVAVLDDDGNLVYTTPVTDDVIGGLDEAGVAGVLARIEALPGTTAIADGATA
jgi:hypothetical protein